MALTMTRTRTQTTLTKLVTLLANVNGELEFVRDLLERESAFEASLRARVQALSEQRIALEHTLRQFDPTLDLHRIGIKEDWKRPFRARTLSSLEHRYLSTATSRHLV